jgi:hypothetical protein
MKLGCPINKKEKKTLEFFFKKDESRSGLILQIYYPSHKTGVTSLKVNLKKQRSKILNQTNIEE